MRSLALLLAVAAVAPVAEVDLGTANHGLVAAGGNVWAFAP